MSIAKPPDWLITWLLDKIGSDRLFMTLPTAVDGYLRSRGDGGLG